MEKLKPEQVVVMLRKKGMEVTEEQAGMMLEFLRQLSKIVVSKYIKEHRKRGNRCKLD